MGVGPPPRPCPPVDLASVTFANPPEELLAELQFYTAVPTPDMLGFERTCEDKVYKVGQGFFGSRGVIRVWEGGRTFWRKTASPIQARD